jgi:Rps23 Pro-64 3,4-dihydroxylase Tpa1-like proline 4-hydroxylase
MEEQKQTDGTRAGTVLGPLPPYTQVFDFLPEGDHRQLLDWVLDNQASFHPASIHSSVTGRNEVDPQGRIALTARRLDGIKEMLQQRFLAALPRIAAGAGYRGPPPSLLELEIAAHGDGAHYTPHVDIPIGPHRQPISGSPDGDRVLSAVYYFHRLPRAFAGGELRLFRFGAASAGVGDDPANHVDFEPLDNSLVVFPSWVTHEVRRIGCPGADFAHYRFALNCWYCRPLDEKGPSS